MTEATTDPLTFAVADATGGRLMTSCVEAACFMAGWRPARPHIEGGFLLDDRRLRVCTSQYTLSPCRMMP